jgi:hypothetical protein
MTLGERIRRKVRQEEGGEGWGKRRGGKGGARGGRRRVRQEEGGEG